MPNALRIPAAIAMIALFSLAASTQTENGEIVMEPVEEPAIYQYFGAIDSIEDITGTVRLLREGDYRPQGPQLTLSLDDAIDTAQEKNPQMIISRSSLESSLWNWDLVEAGFRGLFDLDARFDENIRTFSGNTFRFDPNEGLIEDNVSNTRNNEFLQVGPRYSQTFKSGFNLQVNPSFEFEHDSDGSFNRSAAMPDGENSDIRGGVNMSGSFPLLSQPRESIERDIENAKIGALSSDLDLYLQSRSTDELVINAYWNLKRLQRQLEITNERLLQSMQIEFIFRTQYEFENASRVQVGEAQIDVLNNQANLINEEGAFRNSMESFNILLGLPVESELNLVDDLSVQDFPISGAECIRLVTENNVEIKNLQLAIRQQQNNLRVARLGQQPDLNLVGSYSYDDDKNENIGIGVVFSWPFGDGGATRARVRVIEESLERLEVQLWNLERQLIQATYSDLRDLQLQKQRIAILERNEKQAEINLDNALFTFKEFGRITFRDMQDTQIDLAQARISLVQSIVAYNIAKSNLQQRIHDYSPSPEIAPLIDLLQ